jgi:hypothetical protein
MSPTAAPTSSIDEIVSRVLAQAQARRPEADAGSAQRLSWEDLSSRLSHGRGAASEFRRRILQGTGFVTKEARSYDLGDFIRFHGSDFVDACYFGLLGRGPDPDGGANFRAMLQSGARKTDVLAMILHSPEGRRHRARVRGLTVHRIAAVVFRIPLVGYLAECAVTLAFLPGLARAVRAMEANDAVWRRRFIEETEAALRRIEGEASRSLR